MTDKKSEIVGGDDVLKKLGMVDKYVAEKIMEATDKVAVDIANDARANHTRNEAHGLGRYENKTMNLTNDISPVDSVVVGDDVIGQVVAGMEYSIWVELGVKKNNLTGQPNKPYPFMFPALTGNKDNFVNKIKGLKI